MTAANDIHAAAERARAFREDVVLWVFLGLGLAVYVLGVVGFVLQVRG